MLSPPDFIKHSGEFIMARITHLKIKIHTLADEARHIRREERKAKSREFYASADQMVRKADSLERYSRWEEDSEKSQAAKTEAKRLRERAQNHASPAKAIQARNERLGLAEHRRVEVRQHSRSCLLAYGYLRGTPYKKIEATHRPDNAPDWKEIEKLISRFGGDPSNLKAWREGKEVARAA